MMDATTINYMLGHVLLNGNTSPREWSAEELTIAFAILPAPKKSLAEFKAFFSDDQPEPEAQVTEAEMLAHNTAQLAKKGK